MENALIIFAKNPVYGTVKTRLAATAGDDVAFKVYLHLLKLTEATVRNIAVEKTVYFSSCIQQNDGWENSVYNKQIQQGNDLGERMQHALINIFDEGKHKAVIIGTDCAELNADIVEDAFLQLENCDVVIGPAKDGGYYLIGMNKYCPSLFENIDWSTVAVLRQTLLACNTSGLTYHLLPTLADIDTEDDWNQAKISLQTVKQTRS